MFTSSHSRACSLARGWAEAVVRRSWERFGVKEWWWSRKVHSEVYGRAALACSMIGCRDRACGARNVSWKGMALTLGSVGPAAAE